MSPTYASFLLALPALVAAHGHVELVRADGVTYQGWNSALKFQNPIPETVGWQADNLDNGFVEPNAYDTDAIACHKQSKPNGGYVTVQPGSEVTFLWDTWPESHKGPIIDYIAPCNGDCNSLSAGDLRFTKIQEAALISGSNPGTWVTDELIANNFSSTVTIPNVAPGNYVIRHEIIALHSGSQVNGAQSYPQCINFKVEGSGTTQLTGGVPATSFYTPTDPGIHFTLWQSFDSYPIPGPALAALKKRGHAKDFAL